VLENFKGLQVGISCADNSMPIPIKLRIIIEGFAVKNPFDMQVSSGRRGQVVYSNAVEGRAPVAYDDANLHHKLFGIQSNRQVF
jgi:hypothetical protein